ncbi:MAG: hypothetical protein COA78_02145 [Blastopirellula sp.]|nr:MAG: hypothetical protein COA78_02145 [Blastopirellula sp.]
MLIQLPITHKKSALGNTEDFQKNSVPQMKIDYFGKFSSVSPVALLNRWSIHTSLHLLGSFYGQLAFNFFM